MVFKINLSKLQRNKFINVYKLFNFVTFYYIITMRCNLCTRINRVFRSSIRILCQQIMVIRSQMAEMSNILLVACRGKKNGNIFEKFKYFKCKKKLIVRPLVAWNLFTCWCCSMTLGLVSYNTCLVLNNVKFVYKIEYQNIFCSRSLAQKSKLQLWL